MSPSLKISHISLAQHLHQTISTMSHLQSGHMSERQRERRASDEVLVHPESEVFCEERQEMYSYTLTL